MGAFSPSRDSVKLPKPGYRDAVPLESVDVFTNISDLFFPLTHLYPAMFVANERLEGRRLSAAEGGMLGIWSKPRKRKTPH